MKMSHKAHSLSRSYLVFWVVTSSLPVLFCTFSSWLSLSVHTCAIGLPRHDVINSLVWAIHGFLSSSVQSFGLVLPCQLSAGAKRIPQLTRVVRKLFFPLWVVCLCSLASSLGAYFVCKKFEIKIFCILWLNPECCQRCHALPNR